MCASCSGPRAWNIAKIKIQSISGINASGLELHGALAGEVHAIRSKTRRLTQEPALSCSGGGETIRRRTAGLLLGHFEMPALKGVLYKLQEHLFALGFWAGRTGDGVNIDFRVGWRIHQGPEAPRSDVEFQKLAG